MRASSDSRQQKIVSVSGGVLRVSGGESHCVGKAVTTANSTRASTRRNPPRSCFNFLIPFEPPASVCIDSYDGLSGERNHGDLEHSARHPNLADCWSSLTGYISEEVQHTISTSQRIGSSNARALVFGISSDDGQAVRFGSGAESKKSTAVRRGILARDQPIEADSAAHDGVGST